MAGDKQVDTSNLMSPLERARGLAATVVIVGFIVNIAELPSEFRLTPAGTAWLAIALFVCARASGLSWWKRGLIGLVIAGPLSVLPEIMQEKAKTIEPAAALRDVLAMGGLSLLLPFFDPPHWLRARILSARYWVVRQAGWAVYYAVHLVIASCLYVAMGIVAEGFVGGWMTQRAFAPTNGFWVGAVLFVLGTIYAVWGQWRGLQKLLFSKLANVTVLGWSIPLGVLVGLWMAAGYFSFSSPSALDSRGLAGLALGTCAAFAGIWGDKRSSLGALTAMSALFLWTGTEIFRVLVPFSSPPPLFEIIGILALTIPALLFGVWLAVTVIQGNDAPALRIHSSVLRGLPFWAVVAACIQFSYFAADHLELFKVANLSGGGKPEGFVETVLMIPHATVMLSVWLVPLSLWYFARRDAAAEHGRRSRLILAIDFSAMLLGITMTTLLTGAAIAQMIGGTVRVQLAGYAIGLFGGLVVGAVCAWWFVLRTPKPQTTSVRDLMPEGPAAELPEFVAKAVADAQKAAR